MDYVEVYAKLSPREPWAEILVAQLAEIGFDSFVDTEDGVQCYIPKTEFCKEDLLAESFLGAEDVEVDFTFEVKEIAHQNWNAVWESDFEPVIVEEYLSILAPFHDKENASGMIVEIQPQMSFGTGHHQTTWMMSKALFELSSIPEKVLDMGTGTGVLAIIAEKLGAKEILAIDIEDWSVENTLENANRNKCKAITGLCGDIDLVEGKEFGLILANINKNVLKSHMESYANALIGNGTLLLSGFFDSDVEELVTFAQPFGLIKKKVMHKDNWAMIELTKTN